MTSCAAGGCTGIVDASRVGIVGGSHGGFLAGHLIGQFPAAFRCAVMRNPVTNISLMVGLSDITDWCYVEVRMFTACVCLGGRHLDEPV